MTHTTERLRLIQLGVTGWGESWLDRTMSSTDWDVVAIANRGEAGRDAARRRHGLPAQRCFATLREALEVDADAVLITSPTELRVEDSAAAFEAGLHVLVEKPMALDMESAQIMVGAAHRAGRILMVSQNYRYRKAAREVTRLIGEGWLGEVRHADIAFRKEIHYDYPDVIHGFSRYELVRDCSIHHFDQLRGLLHREPVDVIASYTNPPWSWFAHPPVVDAVISLDNGGAVHYYGSLVSRGAQTSWDGDWYIECDGGQIDFRNNIVRVRPEDNWRSIQLDGYLERQGWLEAQLDPTALEDRAFALQEFARAIRDDVQPATSGEDNLRSLALTHAVRGAASTGSRWHLSDVLASA